MKGIVFREYWALVKGFKSIIIVLFILGVSLWSARFIASSPIPLSEDANPDKAALAGLTLVLLLLGAIFVYTLSHDIVNRDIELQRMRLLITKTSRRNVIIGKFAAVWLFWATVTLVAFIGISLITKTFVIADLLKLWVFLAYHASAAVMISTCLRNHTYTVILGVLLGIAMPILGVWSAFAASASAQVVRYILPYYPMTSKPEFLIVSGIEIGVMLAVSILLFNRKEL